MTEKDRKKIVTGEGYSIILAHSGAVLYPEEAHDALQICVPLAGGLAQIKRWDESGSHRVSTFSAGHVIGFASMQPHEVNWMRNASVVSVYVHHESLIDILGPGEHIGVLKQGNLCAQDACMSQLCQDIYNQAFSNEVLPPAYMDVFVSMLLLRLAGNGRAPEAAPSIRLTPEVVQSLIESIDENMDSKISVTELARRVDMSVFQFIRKFKMELGQTPYQFIISRRMERACHLLSGSDCTTLEIALAVGMSPTQLARAFSARFGLNPAEYRKTHHG